jgi:hypothetical protein
MALREMAGAKTLELCSVWLGGSRMSAIGLLVNDLDPDRAAARNTDRNIVAIDDW